MDENLKINEYRLAIFGLDNVGKTSIIKRVCFDMMHEGPHSTEQYQDTAVFGNSFVYFWDFPQQTISSKNADYEIIGFGGVIFVLDATQVDKLDKDRQYIEDIMKSRAVNSLPLLILINKYDLVEDPSSFKAPHVMNDLLINLKKGHCILFSASTGYGIDDLQQWITKSARTTYMSDVMDNNGVSLYNSSISSIKTLHKDQVEELPIK